MTVLKKMTAIKILSVFVAILAGCSVPTDRPVSSSDHELTASPNDPHTRPVPKDIVVFMGRGGCCYGHIFSIDKSGNLRYTVGTYSVPLSSDERSTDELLRTFDPNLVKVDRKYPQKNQRVSAESLERHLAVD